MRIIKAILGGGAGRGEAGKDEGFSLSCDGEEIAQSLIGNYRQEHLFSLKQAVELFEYYQEKIGECEAEMDKYLGSLPQRRRTRSRGYITAW
jgi:transposase